MISDFDAVVLAGGRGSRLGGGNKPELRVGGRRMLDIALAAAVAARRVVVVGDVGVPDGVLRTREDPPFGGPVAGLDAGVAALPDHAPWTLVLASDLPGAEAAVAALLRAEPGPTHDGACLQDHDGRLQLLLGCYRSEVLAHRLANRGDPPVTAVWRLMEPMRLLPVDPGDALLDDLDTPADAARWERQMGAVEW